LIEIIFLSSIRRQVVSQASPHSASLLKSISPSLPMSADSPSSPHSSSAGSTLDIFSRTSVLCSSWTTIRWSGSTSLRDGSD
jgi:hypothetical protein